MLEHTNSSPVKTNDSLVSSVSFDVEAMRAQFPTLHQEVHGKPLVYLDNAATTQKPQAVIDKEREVEEGYFANAYRGKHAFGARIDEELEASRNEQQSRNNALKEQVLKELSPGIPL